ncbi:MAG: hypothetical protein ACJ74G_21165 [Blastocatellia bacterium]
MIRFIYRALLLGALFFVLLTARLYAQSNFVYVNNGHLNNHSVLGYVVAANGTLTEIPGSPFLTNGQASDVAGAMENLVVAPVGNFLYVPNGSSGTVTVFSINPQTGFLTPAPGSPFSIAIPVTFGIRLAVTGDNRFLYAAESSIGMITAFRVAADGSLTRVPGSPFRTPYDCAMAVSPDGRFLFAVSVGTRLLSVYRIGADGGLTLVPGSQFQPGDEKRGDPAQPEVNCVGSRLFIGERASGWTRVEVWNIAANGLLSAVPGSIFEFLGGSDAQEMILSPDERHLFIGNENARLTVLNVATDGGLSQAPGSPFYVGISTNEDRSPRDLTTNQAGTLLFVANGDATIGVFRIAADGRLSEIPGSPFPGHSSGTAIAAYPPKHCGPSYDTCLQDDGSGSLLQINSTTGEYRFSNCRGLVIAGTGSLTSKGSHLTLQHNVSNLRLLANLDTSTHRATASVQSLTSGTTFTITDRDTTNNSCACSN